MFSLSFVDICLGDRLLRQFLVALRLVLVIGIFSRLLVRLVVVFSCFSLFDDNIDILVGVLVSFAFLTCLWITSFYGKLVLVLDLLVVCALVLFSLVGEMSLAFFGHWLLLVNYCRILVVVCMFYRMYGMFFGLLFFRIVVL